MTSCEKILYKHLVRIGYIVKHFSLKDCFDPVNTIYFQFQPLKSRKFKFDFASEILKIGIDVDGRYWHGSNKLKLKANQIEVKLNDKEKDSILESFGWKIIRINPEDTELFFQSLKNSILIHISKNL